MSNPYNLDPRRMLIRSFGQGQGHTVFLVDLAGLPRFDACVYRDMLARFILDEFEGDAHLGNDNRFISDLGNNLELAVRLPVDVTRLRGAFRVL